MGTALVGEVQRPEVRRGVRAGVFWRCLLRCLACLGSSSSRQVCQGRERDLVKPGGVWVRMLLRVQVWTEAAGSVGNDRVDVTYW